MAKSRRSESNMAGILTFPVDYGRSNQEKGPLFVSGVRRQSDPQAPAQAAGALLERSK